MNIADRRPHKALKLSFIALLCLLAPPKPAAIAFSGNEILAICDEGDRGDHGQWMLCLGYLSGIADGYSWGNIENFCMPDGVTRGQVKDLVIKKIQENPSIRHLDAGLLATLALRATYPCTN